MNYTCPPAFDVLFEALSSGNKKNRTKIEKYVLVRSKMGPYNAGCQYPEVKNIVITDPVLKECWETLLNTIDGMRV